MLRSILVTCLTLLALQQIDAQESERYKLPVFVAIIVKQGDRILLLQRENTGWMDGFWGMPGGGLEPNETITEAAARESYEEVGIRINPEDLKLVHVMHVKRGGNKDVMGFMFLAQKWQGVAENREPHRCSQVQWFDIHALPPNMVLQNAHGFEQALKGNLYSAPRS